MIGILPADFSDVRLTAFLEAHLAELAPTAPDESRHALAIAAAAPGLEELKNMRTDPARRGEGIGARFLQFALGEARSRDIGRIVLETGGAEYFAVARSLYRSAGFTERGPFGAYRDHTHSVFMELML